MTAENEKKIEGLMSAFGGASIDDVAQDQPDVSDSLMSRDGGIWDTFTKINKNAIEADTGYCSNDAKLYHDAEKASICVASGFMFNINNASTSIVVKSGRGRTKAKSNSKYDSSMADDQKRSTIMALIVS